MKILYLFLIAAIIFLLNISSVFSQNAGEYNSLEGSVGFSHQRVGDSGGFNSDAGFNGFDVSVTRNITRYLGIKGDFSGAYKSNNFSVPGLAPGSVINFKASSSVYNFLGGIQVKDNRKSGGLKPFFHALAGGATITQDLTGTCPSDVASVCSSFNYSTTKFAAAFGGGLDIKAGKRISIRVIQADYNPIFLNGGTANNFRIGAGIVFH